MVRQSKHPKEPVNKAERLQRLAWVCAQCALVAFGWHGHAMAFAQDGSVQEPPQQLAEKQAWLAEHGGGGDDGGIAATCSGDGANLFYPFSATDGTWILALGGNDDGSTNLITLPFEVNFFGDSFSGLYINNNGNVTFGSSSGSFSSTGFPTNGIKMIAAFWADVDTRPAASGRVWRKSLDTNTDGTLDTFVVTWDNVGYYSNQIDKLNTFQIILTDGTNQSIGLGARAAFSFDNMCWTTGSASDGSGGFGGIPATVGVNRGNGVDFFQVGRFNQNNANFDGPGGNNDGVDYLDGKFFTFSLGSGGTAPNVPPVCTNLPVGNAVNLSVGQPFDLVLNFIPPEATQTTSVQVLNQSTLEPLGFSFTPTTVGSLTTLRVQWTPSGNGVGSRVLQLRATDNGAIPASSDFSLSFSVAPLAPTLVQASDGSLTGLVQVTWTPSAGATAYDILRRIGDGAFSTIASVGNVAQYNDASAAPGQQYFYAVIARGGGLASQPSAADSGYAGLSGSGASISASDGTQASGVRVSWQPVVGAVGYRVFRAEGEEPLQVGAVGASTSFFTDNTAVPGVPASYFVRPVLIGGALGPPSQVDSGWRAMQAPLGVVASDGSNTESIELSWTAAAGAVRYIVLRSQGNAAPVLLNDSVTGPPFFDQSAVAGLTYSYSIRAVGQLAGAVSPNSIPNDGWRGLVAPTAVSATDGTVAAGVVVSWLPSTGAATYRVVRAVEVNGAVGPAVQLAAGITSLQFTDSTAAVGAQYRYTVRAAAANPLRLSGASAFDVGYRLVPAPASVNATDGTSTAHVGVNWSGVLGATGYQVLRRIGTATFEQVGSVSGALVWSDTTASPGVPYEYAVRTVAPTGLSQPSAANDGHRKVSAPVGVAASDGTLSEGVRVQWGTSEGAQGYEVWRAAGNIAAARLATVPASAPREFIDATATPGVVFAYSVKALGAVGASASSTPDSGFRQPVPPTGVLASDGTSTQSVAVSWNAVPNALGYKVFRSTGGSAPTLVANLGASVVAWNDGQAATGVVYEYSLRALMPSGESAASGSDTGYRGLAAPTAVQASDGTRTDGVQVSWIAVPGATSYQVLRSLGSSVPVSIGSSAAAQLAFIDGTATPGQVFNYFVTALNAAGPSALSAANAGYRQVSPPTNVQATDGTLPAGVQVTWSAATGAVGYRIFRATMNGSTPGTATQIGSTSGAVEFFDAAAVPGPTYRYTVRALGAPTGSVSVDSSADLGSRGLPPPASVVATDGQFTDRVVVSWAASAGASTYEVFRSDSSSPLALAVVGTSFNDTSALPGTLFAYTVRAVGSAGPSAPSAPDNGFRQLVAPTGVQASDGISSEVISIAWNPVAGATSYEVSRGGTTAPIAVTAVTSYVDSPVNGVPGAGHPYTYSVRARGAVGLSGSSSADTGYRGLAAPATVQASDGTSALTVSVAWTAVPGASVYRIWRAAGSAPASVVATVANAGPYFDATASIGVVHRYSVCAVSMGGNGVISVEDDGCRRLPAPSGVAASDGTSSAHVAVNWQAVSGAVGYEVFRDGSASPVADIASGTAFIDTQAQQGVQHAYSVRARGGVPAMLSLPSTADVGFRQMPAPASVIASDGALSNGVQVEWAPVIGASSYQVFRAPITNGVVGPLVQRGVVSADQFGGLTFLDGLAVPGVRYAFRVSAVGSAPGASSLPSEFDFGHCNRAGPTGVQATDNLPALVRVTWTLAAAGTPAV
ncbi:MAG: hypothetical protein EBR10_10890, partial [Planctomycetes bacterium]|nr:hypothetical protein [Planctomycetota bacterium]